MKKININFGKHNSIGNVYDETVVNNTQKFANAKSLYDKNTSLVYRSINEVLLKNSIASIAGATISIPVESFDDSRMLESLEFQVDAVSEHEIDLALTKVNYK